MTSTSSHRSLVNRPSDSPTERLVECARQREEIGHSNWPPRARKRPRFRGLCHGRYWARTRGRVVGTGFFAVVKRSEVTSGTAGALSLAPRLATSRPTQSRRGRESDHATDGVLAHRRCARPVLDGDAHRRRRSMRPSGPAPERAAGQTPSVALKAGRRRVGDTAWRSRRAAFRPARWPRMGAHRLSRCRAAQQRDVRSSRSATARGRTPVSPLARRPLRSGPQAGARPTSFSLRRPASPSRPPATRTPPRWREPSPAVGRPRPSRAAG